MASSDVATDSDSFVPEPFVRRGTFQDPSWNERNLLSLDGGGVRGYWSLLVLEKLMEAIGEEEHRQALEADEDVHNLHSFLPSELPPNVTQCPRPPRDQQPSKAFYAQRFLPCHYFDLLCGSSTGSLIAIMLCRFRMTVQDCLQEYEKMSHSIFGNPRWISQRNVFIVPWPKYSAKAMERAFKEVTDRRGERLDLERDASPLPTFKTKPGVCSMFATTFRRTKSKEVNVKTLYLLRSYIHPEKKNLRRKPWRINFTSEGDMEIWKIARAATAAPFYFSELKIKSDSKGKVYYSDGGFGQTNNPTLEGIRELETLHRRLEGDNVISGSIGVIVSIGTARADDKPGGTSIFKRAKEAFGRATNPQHVAEAVNYDDRRNCWRFNDEQGLKIELDDWKPSNSSRPGHKSIALMRAGFNEWLLSGDNIDTIKACARELVIRRRQRTLNAAKWERFATVAEFHCPSSDCHNTAIETRDDFIEHFDSKHARQPHEHSYGVPEITTWRYPSVSTSRSSTVI
ncbi:acyl transferase/acyl hydrolase/lysophospholipase [Boeremia exigua]|uniref:acyl transferase/acyl hydrolase/lysophospholipase n=1 Tax=Boeremia exigua TaxID=749465 RepID=UPI001E8E9DE5|nr:acyl transferase/acyl hydrolase/lysophospholipase [Boeremia exigua]KAH6633378.1 acyl transferase/acyl hydrolase/lysophospholipase [Boeremia exigua]